MSERTSLSHPTTTATTASMTDIRISRCRIGRRAGKARRHGTGAEQQEESERYMAHERGGRIQSLTEMNVSSSRSISVARL
jgi:hypothetical protein